MTARTEAEVWVVDDDRSIRRVLDKALTRAGLRVRTFESGDAVLAALRTGDGEPDALFCDVRMPGTDGFGVLARIAGEHPEVPVVMMTAYSDLESTVSAYREGAFEFLAKPLDVDEVVAVAGRAVASAAGPQADGGDSADPDRAEARIVGAASAMQEVFRAIGRLSRSTVTVLITGESGTGKELVARALHEHSPCANGPFIAVNTPAVPPELLESELFGHERGAFTGAHARYRGRFEQAHGGTLFLDEIGDMPAELQTRLLRVLADQEFYRVGGHTPVRVEVRIVAATHQDLGQRVRDGRFREDLFHRLNVIGVRVPAVRERREDVPTLARHFLAEAAAALGVEHKVLAPETEAYLSALPWPGNVRQIENTCSWLTVMAAGREILVGDLPPELRTGAMEAGSAASAAAAAGGRAEAGRTAAGGAAAGMQGGRPAAGEAAAAGGTTDAVAAPGAAGLEEWEDALARWADERLRSGAVGLMDEAAPRFERTLIEAALRHGNGLRHEAARLLGWGRNTLTRKLARADPDAPSGRR